MPWRADASGFASLAICANRKWRVAPGTKRYTPSVAATRMLFAVCTARQENETALRARDNSRTAAPSASG